MELLPVLLVLFLVIFFIILLIYSICVKLPLEYRYEDRPNPLFLYLRLLRVAWQRKKNVHVGSISDLASSQNRIETISKDCRLDPGLLSRYKEICGYPKGDTIPVFYLHLYFAPTFITMVTCDEFKLNPLGIIHTGQTLTQHKSLEHLHKEPFDIELALIQCKPVERGIQLQMSMKTYDRREMCIVEGVATLLYKHGQSRTSMPDKPVFDQQADLIRSNEVIEEKLSANLGRRFAWVSGDANPIHLYGWTARLCSFKQQLVHGQWTVARCLAHMQSSGLFALTPPYTVNVEFKKPVFLPSTVLFTFIAQANKDSLRFKVEDKETRDSQLIGFIQRS